MTQPITIYSFPISGHAHRIRLFASIAGIAYETIDVDLVAGENRQAEFLALNPSGQIPVIRDGDVVISDSNAILVYLARQYAPHYLPQDPVLAAEVQKFLSLAAGELAYGLAAARRINVFNAPLDAGYAKMISEQLLERLDAHMVDREFLVGDSVTIADIAIYTYTAHAPEGGISLQPYPNVQRLLSHIEALDGFIAMQTTAIDSSF